jgi:hypothetical protein
MITLFIALLCIHTYALLGTLAKTREGRDVELNPKMVLVDPSRGWKDPRVHTWSGGIIKTTQANLTNSRQIPGKPRSIISLLLSKQLSIYVICIVALSGRS